ncbi:MAG: dephospho-CoA kinase [Clostridia bacterium]|nr:dephospho-CoA kinase [Clostridia bacterium]
MSYILGLTGPTGAGKSVLSKKAREMGFYVIDCDKTARKAVENKECLEALVLNFGKSILDEKGRLIRAKLAEKAFTSPDKTELLNRVIFPFITELILDEIRTSDKEKILLDAPTLYESGIDSICGAVLAVLADKNIRLERIVERDKIERNSAQLRIGAGKTDQYYKERTPYILYNNGDKQKLYDEFISILNTILEVKHV